MEVQAAQSLGLQTLEAQSQQDELLETDDFPDFDPKNIKVVDLKGKTGKFDFAKIGAAVDANDSISTTASGAESISFSCGTQGFGGSIGMESWRSMDARRRFGHQPSNLQDVDEEAELHEEQLTKEEDLTLEALNMEPIKITSTLHDLPSVGSKDHGSGRCKPCAWFWKPGSCSNGRECFHCHLCPAGEIKSRKKTKNQPQSPSGLATGLSEPAFLKEPADVQDLDEQNWQEQQPLPGDRHTPPGLAIEPLPSVGAELHATGQCRPCAWFYKTQGCSNGRDCKHCHLCPEGELKNRKKKTHAAAPKTQTEEGQPDVQDGSQSPALPPPPGLPSPIGQMPTAGASSVGSVLHATRECKPCAWYWKPNSCSNGKDCLHCHLCPESEIKKRKKAKLESMRTRDGDEDSTDGDPQRPVSSSPKSRSRNRSSSRGKSSTPPPPPLLELQVATNPDFTNEDTGADLPSSGSALHALGKCKPCAWHWKPGGCTNGSECCHCHQCPPGELKGRRKAKETAMRVGALLPTRTKDLRASPKNPRTMHVLNLFPLLAGDQRMI